MNLATLLVLAIVIALIANAVYGVYRMARDHTYCEGCPNRAECCNPINCRIRNDPEVGEE